MKKILCVFFVFCFIGIANAENKIRFNESNYILKYSEKNLQNGGYFNEYIRNSETLDNFTRMLTVSNYPKINDPIDFARKMGESIKKQNPLADYEILTNKKTTEVLMHFFIWEESKKGSALEFNVFKFKKETQEKGLLSIQYVFRNVGLDIKEYEKELTKNRENWIKNISKLRFPLLIKKEVGI